MINYFFLLKDHDVYKMFTFFFISYFKKYPQFINNQSFTFSSEIYLTINQLFFHYLNH
jgi:hypothetical protein